MREDSFRNCPKKNESFRSQEFSCRSKYRNSNKFVIVLLWFTREKRSNTYIYHLSFQETTECYQSSLLNTHATFPCPVSLFAFPCSMEETEFTWGNLWSALKLGKGEHYFTKVADFLGSPSPGERNSGTNRTVSYQYTNRLGLRAWRVIYLALHRYFDSW